MNPDSAYILRLGATCFFVSLALMTITQIFNTIYHKRARMQSFVVIDHAEYALFLPNPVTKRLKILIMFFAYSMFTFFIFYAKTIQAAYWLLAGIYTACLLLALADYRFRKRQIARLDKKTNTLEVKEKIYSLATYALCIDDRRFVGPDGSDTYGLYLQHEKEWKLVHGYSIRTDIQALKDAIESRARAVHTDSSLRSLS
jgi:hypothetical protein